MNEKKAMEILRGMFNIVNSGTIVTFEEDQGHIILSMRVDKKSCPPHVFYAGKPVSDKKFERNLEWLHGMLVEGCSL